MTEIIREKDFTLRSVRLQDREGIFDMEIKEGRIEKISPASDRCARGGWLMPALRDFHFHSGWTDFDTSVTAARPLGEVLQRQADSAKLLVSSGFLSFRDAGGSRPDDLAFLREKGCEMPDITDCAGMITGDNAAGAELRDAPWVKIFATGGVGMTKEKVLEPQIPEDRFRELVSGIHASGRKVMVHVYGGPSLDWAIDAGVDSVEHCVYMTAEQTGRLAAGGIPLVLTSRIYQILADRDLSADCGIFLPDFIRDNARSAVQAHVNAAHFAQSAGVTVLPGTDFYSDPLLAAHESEELFSMVSYGFSLKEIWEASSAPLTAGAECRALLFACDPYTLRDADAYRAALTAVYMS